MMNFCEFSVWDVGFPGGAGLRADYDWALPARDSKQRGIRQMTMFDESIFWHGKSEEYWLVQEYCILVAVLLSFHIQDALDVAYFCAGLLGAFS